MQIILNKQGKQMIRKFSNSLMLSFFLLFTLCNVGCAGNTIEYDSSPSKLIGKVVIFNIPVGYLLISEQDKRVFDKEAVKIGRKIYEKRELDDQFSHLNKYPKGQIEDGMKFTIVGSYWVRKGLVEREFGRDLHMVVLRDENNILSVCWMRFLTDNSNVQQRANR